MPSRGGRRTALDAAMVAWIVAWALMGLWVGREVRDLGEVSTSVGNVGGAIVDTGRAIESLDDLPLVGDGIAAPGREIREVGERTQRSAVDGRETANSLATLLGLSVALIPTLPLLVLYLPGRISLERDRRAIGRGVPEELLARRALVHLPLHRLDRVTADPLGDVKAGRHAALARAELERLGFRAQVEVSGPSESAPG